MAVQVEEALHLIYKHVVNKSIKILPIEQVLGHVLAQEIEAAHNLPPYDNSAMDGYAVKISDSGKCVQVKHTIFAGDNSNEELACGFAIKIMTGARIPQGCQCIVPAEDTKECEDGVLLPDNLVLSKHIRMCGEDIQSGSKLLSVGERLHAHHITLLASQGISHVKVYKKPRIALFASGNELKMHFENVEAYQLYNTNTPTFFSRACELGCEVDFIGTSLDTLQEINLYIQSALDSNLIITSGGISVGDADFTKEAFEAFAYENIFDKIEIKPGKPTTFGRIGNTYVLNLPGNPLAAALNFELFAQSIILALSGDSAKYLNAIHAKMKHDYRLKAGRRTLVPGFFDGEFFTPCEKFAPGMVSPLSVSNGYIMIDEACGFLACGSNVKVLPTRFSFNSKEQVSLVSNS
ncbi:molybdopterin molybdotransferase MoeA [bacterium]|nr:molybdopterin molybdotransferase MoeA [bacterium]MBU1993243.1 molybdopterin molybdotransferase MoeA [bacterium]